MSTQTCQKRTRRNLASEWPLITRGQSGGSHPPLRKWKVLSDPRPPRSSSINWAKVRAALHARIEFHQFHPAYCALVRRNGGLGRSSALARILTKSRLSSGHPSHPQTTNCAFFPAPSILQRSDSNGGSPCLVNSMAVQCLAQEVRRLLLLSFQRVHGILGGSCCTTNSKTMISG